MRILLVDDDEDDYLIIRSLIRDIPGGQFTLEWMSTVPAARAAIARQQHDVYLLDYYLGEANGLSLLREALGNGCRAPLILLTGCGDETIVEEALNAGAADYLVKSELGAANLQRAIRYAVERAHTWETLDRRNHQVMAMTDVLSEFSHACSLFQQLPRLIHVILGYPLVSLWLVEHDPQAGSDQPMLHSLGGPEPETSLRGLGPAAHALAAVAGAALASGRTIARYRTPDDEPDDWSTLAIPFHWEDQKAVLAVHTHSLEPFQEGDHLVLENLAAQTAAVLARIRLYESVEQQRRELALVLSGVADAVLVFDRLGRLELLNPSARALFPNTVDFSGRPLPDAAGYDDLITLLDQAPAGQAIQQGEVRWPDQRVFAALITPIENGGHVVVLNDVTHFKDLERVKNEFLATASHDLKNPLSVILGYCDLIEQVPPALGPEQAHFVARVKRTATHMLGLVHDLIELARVDLQVPLDFEPCELGGLLAGVVEDLQFQAQARSQTLTLQLNEPLGPAQPPEQRPRVLADRMRLRQVVNNLTTNAIKYTPDGGQILLSAGLHAGSIQVVVQDTGIGIPPAYLPYIFDKFYRVESEETREIEGSGLGLAIVKALVEQHGGQVWAESEGLPGKGSRFGFSLPLVAADARPQLAGQQAVNSQP